MRGTKSIANAVTPALASESIVAVSRRASSVAASAEPFCIEPISSADGLLT